MRGPSHFHLKFSVRKPNCSNSETFENRGLSVVALIAGFLSLDGLFLSRKSLFEPTEYNRSNTSVGLDFIFFGKLLVYILRSFQEILRPPEKLLLRPASKFPPCILAVRNCELSYIIVLECLRVLELDAARTSKNSVWIHANGS